MTLSWQPGMAGEKLVKTNTIPHFYPLTAGILTGNLRIQK
jgi:hypothetical protein